MNRPIFMASLWRFKDRLRKYNRHKPTINAQLQRVFPKSGASRLTVRRLFRLAPLRERSVLDGDGRGTLNARCRRSSRRDTSSARCNLSKPRFCALLPAWEALRGAPSPASYSGSKPPCYEGIRQKHHSAPRKSSLSTNGKLGYTGS